MTTSHTPGQPYDRGLNAAIIHLSNVYVPAGWTYTDDLDNLASPESQADAARAVAAGKPFVQFKVPAEHPRTVNSLFADAGVWEAWAALQVWATAQDGGAGMTLAAGGELAAPDLLVRYMPHLHRIFVKHYGEDPGLRYFLTVANYQVGGLLMRNALPTEKLDMEEYALRATERVLATAAATGGFNLDMFVKAQADNLREQIARRDVFDLGFEHGIKTGMTIGAKLGAMMPDEPEADGYDDDGDKPHYLN